MAGGRDERVEDLFFEDQTAEGNPTEEGQVRRVSGDLVAYVGGQARSLTSGSGDVVGPAGATDEAVARYDGATGKLIQDSAVTIDDSGNIATAGTVDGRDVSVDGAKLDGIEAGAEVNDVDSVFGRTGAVVAQASDYDANQVDFTPDGDIAATDVQAAIVEVRDETDTKLAGKVDTSRQVIAGAGLTGGGDLTADRTLDVVAADGSITVNADSIEVGEIADAQHGNRGGGALPADATPSVAGFMSAADKTKLDTVETNAKDDQTITAGAGLTGGGLGDVTLDVAANADGSIVVNANDVQVGVLATDAQHGDRGGGSLHALATSLVAGFLSPADKDKLDGLGVFGQEFQFEQDNAGSTTTSSTYQNKLTLVTPSLPLGNYILFYSWAMSGSNNNTRYESRVQRNGADVVEAFQRAGQANSTFLNAGPEVFTGISGVQTFEIDYRKVGGSGNVTISNAHLVIWRIN